MAVVKKKATTKKSLCLGLTGTTSIKALFQRVRSQINAENGRSLPNVTELTPSPNHANIENGLIRPTGSSDIDVQSELRLTDSGLYYKWLIYRSELSKL